MTEQQKISERARELLAAECGIPVKSDFDIDLSDKDLVFTDDALRAIEAALALTASPTTGGVPESPLSSEHPQTAGVGHAPGSASRDGSGTPSPDDLLD